DALRPFVDAFEIAGLLAVHLRQRHDMLQRLVLGLHEAENLGALDVEARSTGEMDLETAVDADHADVLAGRFGAIARAARDGHLQLGRRPRPPHELLDADAEAGGILRAEAAP